MLTLSAPDPTCTGDVASVTAVVEHGQAPYQFSVVDGPSGLSLVENGDQAELTGTFSEAGDFGVKVRVEDANGVLATRKLTLHVHETPVITTNALGDVCPSENYSATLTASGGDGKTYAWWSDVPAATGLSVQSGTLQGRFVNADDGAGSLDVTLWVASGGCTSQPVTLPLTENAPSSNKCPQIFIADGHSELPAPCANSPYSASFNVTGGSATSYTWSATALPPGLAFDEDTQSVSGASTPGGTLTLEVDIGDRRFERDYVIDKPRTACWLAYLAPATGATQLNFFDPLLQNRHAFPDGAQAAPVLDFKFSPDGHFVAYRTGTNASDAALAVIDVTTFDDQALSFNRVTHYAWSDDSQALAVSFDTDQGRFLGGVKVSAAAGGSPASYTPFDAVPADVDTELVWFAGSSVGFLASLGETFREVQTGPLGAAGFVLTPRDEDFFDNGAYVTTAPDGVFAIPGPEQDHTIDYFPSDDSDLVFHEHVRVAPSGRFTARADAGTLKIFRAIDDAQIDVEPPLGKPRNTADGCDAFLAWADGRDRLACAHATDADHAEILVFDAVSDEEATLTPITVRDGYDFPSTGTTGLARVFSSSGLDLAFATDDNVYAAHVVPGGTTLSLSYHFDSAPDGANAVLAFSPDGRFLLEHRGKSLSLFDLQNSAPGYPLPISAGTSLASAPVCSENLLASAGTYCGESRTRAAFAWSPDSKLVAMATSEGKLIVQDVRFVPKITDVVVTTDCGPGCETVDEFAFQP